MNSGDKRNVPYSMSSAQMHYGKADKNIDFMLEKRTKSIEFMLEKRTKIIYAHVFKTCYFNKIGQEAVKDLKI